MLRLIIVLFANCGGTLEAHPSSVPGGSLVPVDAQPHAPRRRVWDLEPVASVAGRSGEANIVYGYECGSELSKKSTLHVGFPQGPR